jgi:hypothetical protein
MGSAAMKELGIQMMIPAYSPQARRPNLIGSLKMCRAQERAIRNKLEILLNQILVMRAPAASTFRSSYSATRCTRSIIGSSRPRTNILITPLPLFRRKDGGRSKV